MFYNLANSLITLCLALRVVILVVHVEVWAVFRDVCQFWKVHTKFPKLKRSSSDIQSPETASAPGPVLATSLNGRPPLAAMLGKETCCC